MKDQIFLLCSQAGSVLFCCVILVAVVRYVRRRIK